MSKLFGREVDEGKIIEASGDGGVVLDEGTTAGILGEDFMNRGVVTQQATVSSKREATEITPGG